MRVNLQGLMGVGTVHCTATPLLHRYLPSWHVRYCNSSTLSPAIMGRYNYLYALKCRSLFTPDQTPEIRGSQRDVVYLGWPIAPSYMSPNAGGGGELRGLRQWEQLCTWSPKNFGDLTPYLTYARNHITVYCAGGNFRARGSRLQNS